MLHQRSQMPKILALSYELSSLTAHPSKKLKKKKKKLFYQVSLILNKINFLSCLSPLFSFSLSLSLSLSLSIYFIYFIILFLCSLQPRGSKGSSFSPNSPMHSCPKQTNFWLWVGLCKTGPWPTQLTSADADRWSRRRQTEGNPSSDAGAVRSSKWKSETDDITEPTDISSIY